MSGNIYLVLIDAHSKLVGAFCTAVIAELRPLPETVVTDNGTCFLSAEFEEFLTAPYHPIPHRMAWPRELSR